MKKYIKEVIVALIITCYGIALVVGLGSTAAKAYENRAEKEPAKVYAEAKAVEAFNDLVLITKLIDAEVGSKSELCKRLAIDVVLNRLEDPEWPDTVTEVIFQEAQFASVGNDDIASGRPGLDTARLVVEEYSKRTMDNIYYFYASEDYHPTMVDGVAFTTTNTALLESGKETR